MVLHAQNTTTQSYTSINHIFVNAGRALGGHSRVLYKDRRLVSDKAYQHLSGKSWKCIFNFSVTHRHNIATPFRSGNELRKDWNQDHTQSISRDTSTPNKALSAIYDRRRGDTCEQLHVIRHAFHHIRLSKT